MTKPSIPELLQEDEVLSLLNISLSHLHKLRREEHFPVVRISRESRVYLKSSVAEWLKNHETTESESRES